MPRIYISNGCVPPFRVKFRYDVRARRRLQARAGQCLMQEKVFVQVAKARTAVRLGAYHPGGRRGTPHDAQPGTGRLCGA